MIRSAVSCSSLFVWILSAASSTGAVNLASSQPTQVSLPDNGVFAPVARQWNIARAELSKSAAEPSAERVWLLLETGQPDEAARTASKLTGEDPAALVAR